MERKQLGEYLKSLRKKQCMSLREVEKGSGVSNAYIAQIERGTRAFPSADVLRKLAPVYNVRVRELLEAAGYLDEEEVRLSEEEEVERAYQFVISDPKYKSGTRIKGELTTEVKRFIVEIYEKATGKKLL